jgi:DNA polymerase-3 subunit beta
VGVKKAGAAILPPGNLIAILRESADAEVAIEATEAHTLVKTSTGKFELPAHSPDEFPDIPEIDAGGYHHEIAAGVLKTMLRRVAFAADKKEGTRWAVTGVLWESEKDKTRLVATDTKRLAMVDGPAVIHGAPEGKSNYLVPSKAITLVDRNLGDDAEPIQVALRTNGASFQTGRWLIHTKLVEGKFPPYRDIIPKKSAVKIPLDPSAFASRVRQAAIMTDDESKRVDFDFQPGKVTLKARGAETGSSEVQLTLDGFDGPGVEIAFDPQYLSEMFRAVEGEPSITLEMTDNQKPAVFRVGDNYLYLVMPMGG